MHSSQRPRTPMGFHSQLATLNQAKAWDATNKPKPVPAPSPVVPLSDNRLFLIILCALLVGIVGEIMGYHKRHAKPAAPTKSVSHYTTRTEWADQP